MLLFRAGRRTDRFVAEPWPQVGVRPAAVPVNGDDGDREVQDQVRGSTHRHASLLWFRGPYSSAQRGSVPVVVEPVGADLTHGFGEQVSGGLPAVLAQPEPTGVRPIGTEVVGVEQWR